MSSKDGTFVSRIFGYMYSASITNVGNKQEPNEFGRILIENNEHFGTYLKQTFILFFPSIPDGAAFDGHVRESVRHEARH